MFLFFTSLTLHTLHQLGMWVIVGFALIHIHAATREDVMSRQTKRSTLVSGWRMFEDDAR
jgi:Ni/Fe-hydrogenase 1 B-type cytochrome subunit